MVCVPVAGLASHCPEDAIKLTINEKKGLYVSEVDDDSCNSCGICYKVFPGHKADFNALNLGIFGKEPENVLHSRSRLGFRYYCCSGLISMDSLFGFNISLV